MSELAGFSKERLKRVTACIQFYIDQGVIAGAVTLIHRRGEVVHNDVLGWQDREARIPMRGDTLCRIASMSKPITSVAALMLIEEGKLRLGQAVDPILPELAGLKVLRDPAGPLDETYPAPRAITVKDLLIHRSGVPYPITAEGPLQEALYEFNSKVLPGPLSIDAWLGRIAQLPLAYAPGERWHYGFSTDILGILIARVSGMSLPEFLKTRIFEPLGMDDTFFHVPTDKRDRFGPGYAPGSEAGALVIADHPETSRWIDPESFPSGGAGLVSTAADYLKFARMILGRGKLGEVRLLSRITMDRMTTDHLTAEERKRPFFAPDFWAAKGFGLGLSIADNVALQDGLGSAGRIGWPGVWGGWWVGDPKEDMVAVLMIQLHFGANFIRTDFETAVYQAIAD
jgi:CubicO group peptidase (beta-lactamase class C family)